MKILFTLFSAFLLFSCASLPEEKATVTDLHFGGYTLQIPSNVLAISNKMKSTGGLYFIYEFDQPDRQASLDSKFLIVSSVTQDVFASIYQEGCNYALFIDDLYRGTEKSSCGTEALHEYYDALLKNRDYGIWNTGDPNIYYSVEGRRVDVILTGTDRPNLLIQSNFLTKEQMKAIVIKYIND